MVGSVRLKDSEARCWGKAIRDGPTCVYYDYWTRCLVCHLELSLTLDGTDITSAGGDIVLGLVLAADVKLLLDLVHCRWFVLRVGLGCLGYRSVLLTYLNIEAED